MAVSKEGTWDCVRVEEMRAFLSSLPVQAASPGIHGPRPLPQAPAHAGVRWGVGGGEIREAARMETRSLQATHFWLVSWFFLRVFGPASPAALSRLDRVNPLGCSPAGLRSGPFSHVAGGLISLNLMPDTTARKSEQSKRPLPF